MGLKIKTEHGAAKRSDLYGLPPYDLKMKGDLRGRHIPPTDEQLKDMAVSLIDNSQEQPIQGRRQPDGTVFVNAGFTRTGAGRLIVDGFTHNGVVYNPDPEFKLQVKLVNCNDRQAFINNIVENNHRNECSAIDDAHNQEKFRERYSYTDAEISKLYRYKDPNKVGRYKKLLLLNDKIQDLVHFGQMGVTAALDLLDVPEEAQVAIVAASTNSDSGKVNGASVREEVREAQLEDADANMGDHSGPMAEETNGKKFKQRSVKEIKDYFGNVKEYSDDEEIIKFSNILLMWAEGKKSKKQMDNAIYGLRNAEVLADAL